MSEAGTTWAPVLGPLDRTSFMAEQQRHRRQTWRLLGLCALAAGVTGIPMSAIITPVVFGLIFVIGYLGLLPPSAMDLFRTTVITAYQSLGFLIDNLDRLPPLELLRQSEQFVPGLALLFLPGAMISLLVWAGLRWLMLRAGVGGALLTLGVREPRPGDLEEQQLVNVVQEMAIAAGLPPPRVVLLDADVANAVAIGSSPRDATIIVTRRLLDEFDRDETQGALGHLIASVGNDDLHVAMSILAVFQTFGLFLTALEAPYSPRAWRTLWRLLGLTVAVILGRRAGRDADLVGAMLTESLSADSTDDAGEILEAGERLGLNGVHRLLLRVRTFILLPFLLVSLLMKMQQFLFVSMVMGPALALLWRTRRYLADATAVRLTRNPDGLARALVRLANDGGMLPGAEWASHLFIVGAEATSCRAQTRMQQEMAELREGAADQWAAERVRTSWRPAQAAAIRYAQAQSTADKGTLSATHAVLISFHPSLEKRLRRLAAMGAARAGSSRVSRPMAQTLFWIVVAPLFALCAVLACIALGLAFGLALFVDLMVITFSLVVLLALLGVQV